MALCLKDIQKQQEQEIQQKHEMQQKQEIQQRQDILQNDPSDADAVWVVQHQCFKSS